MLDDKDTFTSAWSELDTVRSYVGSVLAARGACPLAKTAFTADCKWLKDVIMQRHKALDEEIFNA